MEACKFINKFIDNVIEHIYANDGLNPDESLYKVFQDNNLLSDTFTIDNKKFSQFILNPSHLTTTKTLFNLLEENYIFLYYDECDSSWVGDHLNFNDLSVKEQEVSNKIFNKQLFKYEELFDSFEH